MEALKEQFFDYEVYPNWWCVVIGLYPDDETEYEKQNKWIDEDRKDDFVVITSDMPNAVQLTAETMLNRQRVNMGYNIKRYDNVILNGVMNCFTPRQLKILSDLITHNATPEDSIEHMKIAPFQYKRFTHSNFIYQDLFDDNDDKSLKNKESCLGLDIRETTVPFDKENLTEQDKKDIIFYCKHDVWSSMIFYKKILKPFIDTKLTVGKVFNIPLSICYKSTNANLSAKANGAAKRKFKDENKITIEIPQELKQYIRYSLPSHVVDRLCLSPKAFEVELFGNTVSYANGGIHSVPSAPPGLRKKDKWSIIAEENEDWVLINADAASFYPALMIAWLGLSRCIVHPEKFEQMYKTRLEYKKVIEPFEDKYGKNVHLAPKEEYEHYLMCKETSQAYKLILNTTFGASANKFLDLYDPHMATYTCRLGQLLLTSLANNIYTQIGKDNVLIMQTNTDGVLCYIRRDKLDQLYAIGEEWTRITHITLEFEQEKKIWQRDVNNYLMLKKNGRVKSKGGYFVTDLQQPGSNRVRPLDRFVCKNAMKDYLINGTNIIKYILGERDISQFIISCDKNNGSGIVREFTDGRPDEVLHKCNRAYASKNTKLGEIKILRKRLDKINKHKAPSCPPHCALINDALYKYTMGDLQGEIDYAWYVQETIDMLNDYWFVAHGTKLVQEKIFDENNL